MGDVFFHGAEHSVPLCIMGSAEPTQQGMCCYCVLVNKKSRPKEGDLFEWQSQLENASRENSIFSFSACMAAALLYSTVCVCVCVFHYRGIIHFTPSRSSSSGGGGGSLFYLEYSSWHIKTPQPSSYVLTWTSFISSSLWRVKIYKLHRRAQIRRRRSKQALPWYKYMILTWR